MQNCSCPVPGAVPGTSLAGRWGAKRLQGQETRFLHKNSCQGPCLLLPADHELLEEGKSCFLCNLAKYSQLSIITYRIGFIVKEYLIFLSSKIIVFDASIL